MISLAAASLAASVSAQTSVSTYTAHTSLGRQTILPTCMRPTGELKVLEQHKVADGILTRTVCNAEGKVYRDIVRNGIATPAPETRTIRREASADASFYEDFESAPDLSENPDFIPEGWSEINTEGNLWRDDMPYWLSCNNWRVTDTGDGYWTAITTNGVKECFIHFAYKVEYNYEGDTPTTVIPIAPQDEWLITPEFVVKEGHKLYFDLEVDLGSVYYYDWSTSQYDYDRLENDLEVLASTDNGESWTPLWKVSSDMVDGRYTDSELYGLMAQLKYHTVSIPLADYFGKEVKLAFRYINVSTPEHSCGNSMAIDAVMVDTPASFAEYNVPEHSLLQGITNDGYADPRHILVLPPYTGITWSATSSTSNEAYSWAFYDPESGEMSNVYDTQEVIHTGVYSGDEIIPYPVLTASNEFNSMTFQFGENDEDQGGIRYTGSVPDIDGKAVNLGNYDFIRKGIITPAFEAGSYCFGTCKEGTWGSLGAETGFGNLFETPQAPLTINEVNVALGVYDADPDAEFILELYEIDDYGYAGSEPIFTSRCTGADVEGSAPYYNMCFKLKDAEGAPTEFVLDRRILMLVSGFLDNPKVRAVGAMTQGELNDADHNYAWIKFYDKNDGWTGYRKASDVLVDYSNALIIGVKGSYNFFHSPQTEFTIAGEEGYSREMEIEAGNAPEKWNVATTAGDRSLSAPVTDEWLTISAYERDGHRYLKFAGEPLGEGKRSKEVTISTIGAQPITITVTQDADFDGIENVTVEPAKVVVGKETITVSGAIAGQPLTLYTANGVIAGNVMADNGGNAVISLRGIRSGIYMLRVGNKVYKVMR